MKNISITIVIIFGIYFFFITFNKMSRNSSADKLEICLDEYKAAYKEQKQAMRDAYTILDYFSSGSNRYNELSTAISEATLKVDEREVTNKISLECDE